MRILRRVASASGEEGGDLRHPGRIAAPRTFLKFGEDELSHRISCFYHPPELLVLGEFSM
jgi:hypothetical protein